MTRHALVTQSSRRQRSLLAASTGRLTVSDHRLRLQVLLSQPRIPTRRTRAQAQREDVTFFLPAGSEAAHLRAIVPLVPRLTGQGPRDRAGQR
jgi:hypothetical protein